MLANSERVLIFPTNGWTSRHFQGVWLVQLCLRLSRRIEFQGDRLDGKPDFEVSIEIDNRLDRPVLRSVEEMANMHLRAFPAPFIAMLSQSLSPRLSTAESNTPIRWQSNLLVNMRIAAGPTAYRQYHIQIWGEHVLPFGERFKETARCLRFDMAV